MMVYTYNEMALTEEAQDLYENYLATWGDGSCFCSFCSMPPCSFCEGSGTDEGHPLSLIDDKDSWEPLLVSAVRQTVENWVVEFEEIEVDDE